MIIKNELQRPKIHWKKLFVRMIIIFNVIISILVLLNIDFVKINLLKQRISVTPNGNFYTQPVEIFMDPPIDADIRYTLDGSQPKSSSDLYSEPILISDTSSIRFAMFKDKSQVGSTQVTDIFINSPHELPIVTLVTNPDNLWDKKIGIYNLNNYEKKGDKWARDAVISLYEPDHTHGFTKDVSIRLHGAGSKLLPQKSFRVSFTDVEYGNTLKYNLFPDNEVKEFDSILLRNAGGDWSYTHLRDPLMQELIEDTDLDLDLQDYRPAVLYLNGEYWGIYNIRERQDLEYLSKKYNASSEEFSINTSTGNFADSGGKLESDKGDDKEGLKSFNNLVEEVSEECNGCTSLSKVNTHIDWQNYRDYLLINFHFNNFDWPYSNLKTWRYNTQLYEPNAPEGLDGRVRWLVYDMDVGFGFGHDNIEEVIESSSTKSIRNKLIDDNFPFRNLVKSRDFYASFLTKYADLLNQGFDYITVQNKIDELAAQIRSEMPRQIDRWHQPNNWESIVPETMLDKTVYITDLAHWEENLNLLKLYAQLRPEEMRNNVVEEFKLSGVSEITLLVNDSEKGYLEVNSLNLESVQYPWTGWYFNDLTITIKAIPKTGYTFVRWESDAIKRKDKLLLNVTKDSSHTAIFK